MSTTRRDFLRTLGTAILALPLLGWAKPKEWKQVFLPSQHLTARPRGLIVPQLSWMEPYIIPLLDRYNPGVSCITDWERVDPVYYHAHVVPYMDGFKQWLEWKRFRADWKKRRYS